MQRVSPLTLFRLHSLGGSGTPKPELLARRISPRFSGLFFGGAERLHKKAVGAAVGRDCKEVGADSPSHKNLLTESNRG